MRRVEAPDVTVHKTMPYRAACEIGTPIEIILKRDAYE